MNIDDPKKNEELPEDAMDISEEEITLLWDDDEDDIVDGGEFDDDQVGFKDINETFDGE